MPTASANEHCVVIARRHIGELASAAFRRKLPCPVACFVCGLQGERMTTYGGGGSHSQALLLLHLPLAY